MSATSDGQVRGGLTGGLIMGGLLLGAVLAASLPLIAAVLVVDALPGVGELRTDGGLARLVNLVWAYPGLFVAGMVASGVGKGLKGRGRSRVTVLAVETTIMVASLTAIMFVVFFVDLAGALLATAIALVLYWPFVRFLERGVRKDEEEQAREVVDASVS
ncbi:hypothetical protein [Pseudokineococcus sp. 1T1Z-3]|uniref:hypothetical protein n=1 Tax=Pseudokineococcus sp. 1T1Z-3 TaxID=3132745 RepID=UPI00309BEC0A